MDPSELIAQVARDTGLSLEQAAQAVKAVTRNIRHSLEEGIQVTLEGFGTFSTVDRQARNIRLHHSGEEINLPACRVVTFTPEKSDPARPPGSMEDRWNICAAQDDRQIHAASMDLLVEETEYTDAIIDLAADMIVSVDAQRKIKIVNKAAQKVYGYTPQEMANMSIAQLYAREEEFLAVGEKMRTQGHFIGEITGRKKNGEEFPARVTALLLRDKNGNVMGSVGYSRDLTEEKASAVAREELAVLKATEALKKDVENITRHDLKSPINGIISFADFLEQADTLASEHKSTVHIIKDLGYRAINMVNLSLGILRMERGSYQLNPASIDLISIMRSIVLDAKAQIKYKQVELRMRIDDRPVEESDTCFFWGEELLSYSMFTNVFKNALEASPKKHPITILFGHAENVMVTIHNFGAVPEEIRSRFFEKYVTSGKSTGTGLGTYSAMLIAKTQHGHITMRSSEEEGTTITVTLPKAPAT
ncbi:MAG: HU family DNA-binding protein [Magnetococcales bacterium]|nr:HU family DNA-binding protein [Magnetococcales bacterium]MBF0323126.1 HU family DNA-binding protein [Magnetococcales bacterium]